ncbi:polysaccharide deacetylase family protein [Roseisolibacter sp. H3M3-2]|uniref:polysaccharide deacetylase family protein n=1 Tax=Roseisolibacter sp. H3M3-2 TaxID=3031323 RepID=UPI0023D9A2CD|nr:polysaccharide deacetylase family protein [Roseisolibacter sp. H3M3-2]MDF1504747.1 polysaccharide deacetylase family protein [Roseisolibacter sp. H3M3-2]
MLLRTAGALGVTRLVARSEWRRRRLLILCYHGISLEDEHRWNPELYMPAEQFRARMRHLREGGYTILPLGEAVRRLYAGDLPPRSVAVTFDDGFHDFLARAVPILREFGIPATNFVATFYSEFPRPVFDLAGSYLLWKARARGALALGAVIPGAAPVPIGTAEERDRAWATLRAHAHDAHMTAAEKDELLADLAAALGIDYAAWTRTRMLQQMRGDELRALPADLVDVALHTHRHRVPDEPAKFAREIVDNRASLGDLLRADRDLALFCYPTGTYDARVTQWLAGLGVRAATTSDPDLCSTSEHPLLLPRFTDTTGQPGWVFEAWASGLYAGLPVSPRVRELRRRRLGARPQAAAPAPAGRPSTAALSDAGAW